MRCTRLGSSEVQSKFAKNGKHYFILLAHNGEIVGQSQMYTHDSSAHLGIRSVMNNAPTAKVNDLSDS
jgi:uncharacterized protein YegP (UPF0339 family)